MRPKKIGEYEVEVYEDKKSEARDNFSVIIDNEDVIALSEDAGIDQFAGSLPPKGKISRDNLGERIEWENTPIEVREAVRDRLDAELPDPSDFDTSGSYKEAVYDFLDSEGVPSWMTDMKLEIMWREANDRELTENMDRIVK